MEDEENSPPKQEIQPVPPGTEALAQQLASLLCHLGQTNNEARSPESNQSQSVTVSVKLNEFNYALWSRMMHLAIGGRGCLNHITGHPPSLEPTDLAYSRWYQNDLTVISWIIQNMEPMLASNYVQYRTAESLWKSLATTYSFRKDSSQKFELTIQANSSKQGQGTIENFYSKLQRIWAEIDENLPNPMKCERDIATYQKLQSETRLFQLLAGINERYEPERRDILKTDPLPTIEAAYAIIRRGAARRGIWSSEATDAPADREIGSGLVVQNGEAMAAKGFRPSNQSGPTKNGGSSSREKIDRSKLRCTHCGMSKHTKEICFQLVGYPDWWEDNHKTPRESRGKATVAMVAPEAVAIGSRSGGSEGRSSRREEEQVGIAATTAAKEERKWGDDKSLNPQMSLSRHLLRRVPAEYAVFRHFSTASTSGSSLAYHHQHEFNPPSSYINSWKQPRNPKEAARKLALLRRDYDRKVKEIRKEYINEMELQRMEKLRKDEARSEALRIANEERRTAKAAKKKAEAIERQAAEEEFRQMLMKERAEKLEYWRMREKKVQEHKEAKKEVLRTQSSKWIGESDIVKVAMNNLYDNKPAGFPNFK